MEPLLAWRIFLWVDQTLLSHIGAPWESTTMIAHCFNPDHFNVHPSPNKQCYCGIYGWKTYPQCQKYAQNEAKILRLDSVTVLIGVVAMTGKIFVYPEGARAERARIVGLLCSNKALDQSIVKHYPLPILEEPEQLEHLAEEYGRFWNLAQTN